MLLQILNVVVSFFGAFEHFFKINQMSFALYMDFFVLVCFCFHLHLCSDFGSDFCLDFRSDFHSDFNSDFKMDVALFASKAEINVFLKFFLHSGSPSEILHLKEFQNKLILAFEANSALIPAKMDFFPHSYAVKNHRMVQYFFLVPKQYIVLSSINQNNCHCVSPIFK